MKPYPHRKPESSWYTRGYLPHNDAENVIQFITYRTYDSLPKDLIERWRLEVEAGKLTEREYLVRVDRHLDLGNGAINLTDALVVAIIIENLMHHAGKKYELIAWVVMINHVHLLLRPSNGNTLESIVHALKSYTATKANTALGRSGPFWSIEYFDRFIRDGEHFLRTKRYIEMNPVKAGLSKEPEDWKFGSAYNESEARLSNE